MRVEEYTCQKERYSIKTDVEYDGIGSVADPEMKNELVVVIKVHRDVFIVTGYLCNAEAPELLHACICAMFELVFEMPVIKTVLLTPDMIWEKIYEPEEEVTEEVKRYASMALCGLREAFSEYLTERRKG